MQQKDMEDGSSYASRPPYHGAPILTIGGRVGHFKQNLENMLIPKRSILACGYYGSSIFKPKIGKIRFHDESLLGFSSLYLKV